MAYAKHVYIGYTLYLTGYSLSSVGVRHIKRLAKYSKLCRAENLMDPCCLEKRPYATMLQEGLQESLNVSQARTQGVRDMTGAYATLTPSPLHPLSFAKVLMHNSG